MAGVPTRRWWVFDRPLRRDPLFLVAVVLAIGYDAWYLMHADQHPTGALVYNVIIGPMMSVLMVGETLGSVREFVRARRP